MVLQQNVKGIFPYFGTLILDTPKDIFSIFRRFFAFLVSEYDIVILGHLAIKQLLAIQVPN